VGIGRGDSRQGLLLLEDEGEGRKLGLFLQLQGRGGDTGHARGQSVVAAVLDGAASLWRVHAATAGEIGTVPALFSEDGDPLLEDGLGDEETVINQLEEGDFVEVDLGDGETGDLGPGLVRVGAILLEFGGEDQGGEEHASTASDGLGFGEDGGGWRRVGEGERGGEGRSGGVVVGARGGDGLVEGGGVKVIPWFEILLGGGFDGAVGGKGQLHLESALLLLMNLIETDLFLGGQDLVADLVDVVEGELQGGEGGARASESFLDKDVKGDDRSLVGVLSTRRARPDGLDDQGGGVD
jgi:hypothetical protein